MRRALLFIMLLGISCRYRAMGPVSKLYYDAGGGDPHKQTGDQIVAWFAARRPFATHLAGTCTTLLRTGRIDLHDRRNADDLKVCLAAKWTQLEPLPHDERRF